MRSARDLARLLATPHLKALIDTHDQIAEGKENYQEPKMKEVPIELDDVQTEAIRMVGIRRKANEPLGLTVSSNVKM